MLRNWLTPIARVLGLASPRSLRRTKRPYSPRVHLQFDVLERRDLMAASLGAKLFGDGLLRIEGTGSADRILVRQDNDRISVKGIHIACHGRSVSQINASRVNRIEVYGLGGNDVIDLGRGSQPLTAPATLSGGRGIDDLIGGDGNDCLIGGQDDEIVRGNSEYICGGGGNDSLYGGSGWDFLSGGWGDDYIIGDWGDGSLGATDQIEGGPGNDSLYGDGGNDSLYGEGGNDFLVGGEGSDHLTGDQVNQFTIGVDSLYGQAGDDDLIGDLGIDFFDDGRPFIQDGNLYKYTASDRVLVAEGVLSSTTENGHLYCLAENGTLYRDGEPVGTSVLRYVLDGNGSVWALQADGDLRVNGAAASWNSVLDFAFDNQNRLILLQRGSAGNLLCRSKLAFGNGGFDPMGTGVLEFALDSSGAIYTLQADGQLLRDGLPWKPDEGQPGLTNNGASLPINWWDIEEEVIAAAKEVRTFETLSDGTLQVLMRNGDLYRNGTYMGRTFMVICPVPYTNNVVAAFVLDTRPLQNLSSGFGEDVYITPTPLTYYEYQQLASAPEGKRELLKTALSSVGKCLADNKWSTLVAVSVGAVTGSAVGAGLALGKKVLDCAQIEYVAAATGIPSQTVNDWKAILDFTKKALLLANLVTNPSSLDVDAINHMSVKAVGELLNDTMTDRVVKFVYSSFAGTVPTVPAVPAPASVVLSAPDVVSVGNVNVGVTVKDEYGNGWTGTATVSYAIPTVTYGIVGYESLAQVKVQVTNGSGTASLNLSQVGTGVLRAIAGDNILSPTYQEKGLTVKPAVATRFVISAPSTVTSNSTFSVVITAVDVYGNLATGYNDNVWITSSESRSFSNGTVRLTNGTATVNVYLTGSGTITVSDLLQRITGTSNYITVPDVAQWLLVSGSGTIVFSNGNKATRNDYRPNIVLTEYWDFDRNEKRFQPYMTNAQADMTAWSQTYDAVRQWATMNFGAFGWFIDRASIKYELVRT